MYTRLHTLLPYGLSSQYQDFLAGDKDKTIRCGLPRFHIASLLELSKFNSFHSRQSLPALDSTTQPHQNTTQRKPSSTLPAKDTMGFQRNIKKINMGPATGKEKRGRAKRKPRISVRTAPKPGSKGNPGARTGASQEFLIALDSDDDAPACITQGYVVTNDSNSTP
jgi:hypothetical protein